MSDPTQTSWVDFRSLVCLQAYDFFSQNASLGMGAMADPLEGAHSCVKLGCVGRLNDELRIHLVRVGWMAGKVGLGLRYVVVGRKGQQ
jgi:hypothetical protein